MPVAAGLRGPRDLRQRSEQNLISSHERAHFRRHANGRLHAAQGLEGRSDFRRMRANGSHSAS